MNLINSVTVMLKGKPMLVKVYGLDKDEVIDKFSRAYVIVSDKKGNVALIYNSKMGIWGFPGGHPNKLESIKECATRECAEEINYSIKSYEARYVLVNDLENKRELQVICFAMLGNKKIDTLDEKESVSDIKFIHSSKVLPKIGNDPMWKDIINSFRKWQKSMLKS